MFAVTTRDGGSLWIAPGFLRLKPGIVLDKLPLWPDKASAERAASALRKAMGIDVIPAPVRVGRK